MFLIDAIKPNAEKKCKTCLGFVPFCVRFAGGNKNIIKKNENRYYMLSYNDMKYIIL